LPPYSKVKGYAAIPGTGGDQTTVILCYAALPDDMKEQDRASSGGPRNLHLLMMSRKSGEESTRTVYRKLADVLVAEEVAFGAMLVEQQQAGTFVAVYFADGGSHQTNSIAVFEVRADSHHLVAK
jgi:hypothetical protein